MKLTLVMIVHSLERKHYPRTLEKDEHFKTLLTGHSPVFGLVTLNVSMGYGDNYEENIKKLIPGTKISVTRIGDYSGTEFLITKKNGRTSFLNGDADVDYIYQVKPTPMEIFDAAKEFKAKAFCAKCAEEIDLSNMHIEEYEDQYTIVNKTLYCSESCATSDTKEK